MENIPVMCYAPPAAKAAGNALGKVLNSDRQPGAFARFSIVCGTAQANAATVRQGRRAAKKWKNEPNWLSIFQQFSFLDL